MKKLCFFATFLFMVSIASLASAYEAGDIVINEIMQNPAAVSDTYGEWFEVYNKSGEDINMNGWVVSDLGSDDFQVEGDLWIGSGEYLVFGRDGDILINGGVEVDYDYDGFILGNDDDEVIITDDMFLEIARVEYDGGTNWPDPTGASMSLCNYNADMNDFANWFESHILTYGAGDFGTPGEANEPYFEVELQNVPASAARGETISFDACLEHPCADRHQAKVWLAVEKDPMYRPVFDIEFNFPPNFGICKPFQLTVHPAAPLGIWTLSANVGPAGGGYEEIWYSFEVDIDVTE